MSVCTTDRVRPCGYVAGLVLVTALLSACGTVSRSDRPASVEDRSGVPPEPITAQGSDVQIAAYQPPAQPRYARPAPKRAVEVLVDKADAQRRAGDLDGATASLERAMRIAPDDAELWHELARVRLAQRRHDLVVELAAKSNALADPRDRELRAANWQLIASSPRALGDARGANEAERRAADYR